MKFPKGSKIIYLSERRVIDKGEGEPLKQFVGDSYFKVVGPDMEDLLYVHIECQTTYDKKIEVRLGQYALTDASVSMSFDEEANYPKAFLPTIILIQIRKSEKLMPESAYALRQWGPYNRYTEVPFVFPIVRMSDYDLEELCTKDLLPPSAVLFRAL